MEQIIEKKPIASTLREMNKGEKVEFPIEQCDSINNTRSRLQRSNRNGTTWSYECDRDRNVVIVTRTA